MKAKRSVAMLAIAVSSLYAGQSVAQREAAVTVCMETDPYAIRGARPLVSAMFASIGVRIDWHACNSYKAGADIIQVRLSHDSRYMLNSNSEALGFAQPYQGTVIVFIDRVQRLQRHGANRVMAHVLVHEITHIIQRIGRHSHTGIMKASWNDQDYFEMASKPLSFGQEDVALI